MIENNFNIYNNHLKFLCANSSNYKEFEKNV